MFGWNKVLTWFIGDDVSHVVNRTRTSALLSILLVLLFFSIAFLMVSKFIVSDFPFLFFIVFVLFQFFLFKVTKSTFWVGNILCLTLFVVMVSMSRNTGGLYSIDLMGIILVPILAITIVGIRSAIFWTLLCIGAVIYTYITMRDPSVALAYKEQTQNFVVEYYLSFHMINLMLPVILVSILVSLNRKLVVHLRESNAILDKNKKALESQTQNLVATQKDLEKSNALLERYAYAASHDLRQPIRNIISFTELFKMKFKKHNIQDEKLDEYMDMIISGTYRMDDRIKEFLEFSNNDDNHSIDWIEINQVINEVTIDMASALSGQDVTFDIPKLPKLKFVKSGIAQVFQNLFSNALKYRKPNVMLEIKVAAVEKELEWQFSVSDNGMGIKPENTRMIFKNFTQIDEQRDGKGIGLATCKEIVARYDGKIWAESDFGKGSTFYFTLAKNKVT